MIKYLYIFLLIFLVACNGKKSQQKQDDLVSKDTTLLKEKDLKKLNYTDYVLDNKAKDKLATWVKYNELQVLTDDVKQANLSFFKGDKKLVETTIKEFTETIPESIKTEAIEARILVVQNMYLRLNNIVNLSTSSKADIKTGIKDFLIAFSNLNFQINKKIEKDSQKIEKP